MIPAASADPVKRSRVPIIDVLPGETEEQAEARAKSAPQAAIHPEMPREEYDRLDRVNWSRLKNMGRSPAHYRHELLCPREDTGSLKRGRVTHTAILEPEKWGRQIAVWRGERRAGKVWEAFRDANADKEILTEAERDTCLDMNAAVWANPDAQRYLTGGRSEVTVTWAQSAPALGAVEGWRFCCKGRLDYVSPTAIVDLKTTRDASPDGFAREAWKYQLHVQAAWYSDGYELAARLRLPYVLIAVEVTPPHVVQVFRVQEELLQLGRETYRALLERLAVCRRTNAWTGYAEGEMALTLPRWAAPRLDDDDVADLDLIIGSEEE